MEASEFSLVHPKTHSSVHVHIIHVVISPTTTGSFINRFFSLAELLGLVEIRTETARYTIT